MVFVLRYWFPALCFFLFISNITAKKEKGMEYSNEQSYTYLLSKLFNNRENRSRDVKSLNNPNIIIVTNQFLKNSDIVRRTEHKGTSPNVTVQNPKKKALKKLNVTGNVVPGGSLLTPKPITEKKIETGSKNKTSMPTTKKLETEAQVNYRDKIKESSSSETKEEDEDDDSSEEVLREKDSEELDTEKSNVWNRALTKKAASHCTKACKKAVKDVCKDYSCKGGLKKGMRKNCKIKCREYFGSYGGNGGNSGGGGGTGKSGLQPYWYSK